MMPPYCAEDAPPGEHALFEALAGHPETEGWIVLHSLAIAEHVRQVQGEADFVVIVPGHGILVIEVKSHRSVQRLGDGSWRLGSQPPTGRSPFQQASEAMHSLREYLIGKHVDLHWIPMLFAVWFTHVRARAMFPDSPEWHNWELLDQEDLQAPARAIVRVLASGAAHLGSRTGGFSGKLGPDAEAAARIATALRPRFELATMPGDLRHHRETQLAAFIDEQYDALDAMSDNRAVLFTGPAGSGKTLLALEAARRETASGGSGLLLCFNQLLGRRLQEQTADTPRLRTGTFHQELIRLTGVQPPPDASPEFWNYELPEHAVEALLYRGGEPEADFLIVDELQDLAREPFLDVLDLLVRGGLSDGRLLLFGDFEWQAIFESGDGRNTLKARVSSLVTFGLTVNCRNLPRIGTVVTAASRMVPGYRSFRRPDDGVDPAFMPYTAGIDQSQLLADAVRTLRADGYALNEIVVLSPLRNGSAAEVTIHPWLRQILRAADGRTAPAGRLRYSTIHAFKGLEAPAVILTDLDQRLVPNIDALLYVGMTRATDRLTAIIETSTLRAAFGANL
jgi:hypothetical protein